MLSSALASQSAFAAEASAPPAYGRFEYEESYREHWAYLPVVRPDVPILAVGGSAQAAANDLPFDPAAAISSSAPADNPIDAFIGARLATAGLAPAPPADRRTLLRRLYLDLIGLLPTPVEQATFLADDSPDAVPHVVDALLARPEYGERWARHWLDIVRYADTNGYERDGEKPSVWRYRDYVIKAFNADKPYDRFVIEQLAGDELPDTNAETQIATTFLRLGLFDDEPADPEVDRYDQLDDLVAAASATFLAQTVRCARCHDHKFEAFSQRDYTRLLAVFEPLKRPQDGRADLDRMVGTPAELVAFVHAQAAARAAVATARREVELHLWTVCKRLEQAGQFAAAGTATNGVLPSEWPADAIAVLLVKPADRDEPQEKLAKKYQAGLEGVLQPLLNAEEQTELSELSDTQAKAEATQPAEPPRAYIWYEDQSTGPVSHLFPRGNPRAPGDAVEPGFPAILVDRPPPTPIPTAFSTGRRLQFANWLVSPANPLTARVMVNRVWQHHFGDGLAGSENDLGVMGEAPTHPELLDWLAAEFMAQNWSLKSLHRLIVLSRTYQASSVASEDLARRDPQDDLLGRFPPRRLEAETIRDCVLQTSGQLKLARGGPGVFPRISEAVLASQSRPGLGWGKATADEAARRSVYVFVKRTLLVPELEVMDFPDTNGSCEDRGVSTVAPQALTLLNGSFNQEQSRLFAARLLVEAPDPRQRIGRAFEVAFARVPTEDEVVAVERFLTEQERRISEESATDGGATDGGAAPPLDPAARAWQAFCLVLFNTNEFVYLR